MALRLTAAIVGFLTQKSGHRKRRGMSKRPIALSCLISLLGLLLLVAPSAAQVNVLTQHNDISRTGANLSETLLNTSNVNVSQFGKLFSRIVDGQIYAQPLVVSGVNMPNQGTLNVVYVATEKNNVYAFDADNPTASAPLWQVNLGTPVPWQETGCSTSDTDPVIGMTGTPVIDTRSGTIYLVSKTKVNGSYFQKLHALDITTGNPRPGSPVVIQATINGTGDGSSGGLLSFDPLKQLNRAGLLLLNDVVYIAFGSHCDAYPYHGWVFAYDATTLAQMSVFNTTPNTGMSGIWQSGQGLVADANGDIYCMTANGSFDANTGGTSYGESFVKLTTPGLTVADWFTPYNFSTLTSGDMDLGSAGPLLLPNTSLLVGGGKQGMFYLVDSNLMGHYSAAGDQVIQSFQAASGSIHGSPVYWNSPNQGPLVYLWGDLDRLKAFRFANGTFQTTPVATGNLQLTGGTGPHAVVGAMLSLSANASTPGSNASTPGSGIIWATRSNGGNANHMTVPGALHAFDASNVAVELWNNQQNLARDDFGNWAKFCPPTIANGKVYLATFSNQLIVYGLNPPPPQPFPPGNGTGLTGEYYDNSDFTNLKLTRVDPSINFSWGSSSPDPSIGPDTFSVRWTGQVQPRYSEIYTFYTKTDDGVRLWVDGVLLIDKWVPQSPTEWKASLSLMAGQNYDIKMEYYENTGGATAQLSWSSPSQSKQIIPQTQLYAALLADTQPPNAPTNLIVSSTTSNSVSLSWTASTDNVAVTGYQVFRGFTLAGTSSSNSFTDSGLSPSTTYSYSVEAYDAAGNLSNPSNTVTATTASQSAGLPSPWAGTDVGRVGVAGSASFSNGTFTVNGSGVDISLTADGFYFVYKALSGNGQIVARVATESNTNAYARAGVMIREGLDSHSRHATMAITPTKGSTFLYRSSASGSTYSTNGVGVAPYWVKLVRSSNSFKGYVSSNGVSWTLVGSVTISMNPNVYVGLAVTSHNNSVLNLSTFDSVTAP
jgi:hypothetical protein